MRSVFKEEIDIVWDNYDYLIKRLGFMKMMETPKKELQQIFTMQYRDLFYQVKNINENKGKTRGEISYSILKLRRLIALWNKNNIWRMNSGVCYSYKDDNKQFPKFDRQNPDIIPTERTIARLQAKAIHQYIENHNKQVDEIKADKTYVGKKPRYIRNLRDLRLCLMTDWKMEEAKASELTRRYGSIVAHKEVNDFSNQTEDFSMDDSIIY